MPWTSSDATRFTHKAKSSGAKSQGRAVANSILSRGGSDASAIRQANAVIKNRFAAPAGEAKTPTKRLAATKTSGGRSRASYEHEPEEKKRTKKFVKRPDAKRMFRTEVDRRSMKIRMRGR